MNHPTLWADDEHLAVLTYITLAMGFSYKFLATNIVPENIYSDSDSDYYRTSRAKILSIDLQLFQVLFQHKNSTNKSSDMNQNGSLNSIDSQDNEDDSTYPLSSKVSKSVNHSDAIASNQDTLDAKAMIIRVNETSLVQTPSVAVSEIPFYIKYPVY